jgi:hypothetical protein
MHMTTLGFGCASTQPTGGVQWRIGHKRKKMLAFVSGPQIHWMQAQPGDPAGLAFILLALLALVAFL